MFKFTHRNPEMQIDKQHTALVLGRHAKRISRRKDRDVLRTHRGRAQEA